MCSVVWCVVRYGAWYGVVWSVVRGMVWCVARGMVWFGVWCTGGTNGE